MTKNEISYTLSKLGISNPTDFIKLDNRVLYISFSDATKTKAILNTIQYKFDFDNEVVIQKRLRKNGTEICYPGTNTPCYNVYSFSSVINIGLK